MFMTQLTIGEIREKLCFVNASLIAVSRSRTSDLATRSVPELIRVTGLEVETRLEQECFVSEYLAPIKRCEIQRRNITREKEFLLRSKWRESVGIEPPSLLAKTSAVLKTERATRLVLSHIGVNARRPGFPGNLSDAESPRPARHTLAPSGRLPPATAASP